ELGEALRRWQKTLAGSTNDVEEAAVLTAGEVQVAARHTLKADISWREGARVASFEISVAPASKDPADDAVVVWRDPRLRCRRAARRRDPLRPFGSFVDPETAGRLAFGRHPRRGEVGAADFATAGEATVPVALQVPDGTISAQLVVDVELDTTRGGPAIVRC